MFLRSFVAGLIVVSVSSPILADEQMQTQEQGASKEHSKSRIDDQEVSSQGPIYGIQLMSQEELHIYRAKMHSLKTREIMEQFLYEHHDLMNKRAKEKGVSLHVVSPKLQVKQQAGEKKVSPQKNVMGPLGW